jgi:hypothetical protein
MQQERGQVMKWLSKISEHYQQTEDGTARAYVHYYIYRVSAGEWRAGRYWFNRDVDFRLRFTSAKVARDYLEIYDSEAVLITAV